MSCKECSFPRSHEGRKGGRLTVATRHPTSWGHTEPETPLIRRHLSLAMTVVLSFAAIACGDEREDVPRQPVNPLLRPARLTETAPADFNVRFETSGGEFVVAVHRDWAPLGVDRFYNLVSNGFYDDVRIYRSIENFMAQFGLNGDPYVNQAWKDTYIVDDPVRQSNTRGRMTFAKGGLHTRTTELFVNFRDNSNLDGSGFAPFGEVIEGMDAVDAIYTGYGEGPPRGDGPYAAMAQARGNEYLDAEFPELTQIIRATIETGNTTGN